MITSFKHKGLKELAETGSSRRVAQDQIKRIRVRIDVLRNARTLEDINLANLRLHRLSTGRYAIDVNGPWRITFEWDGKNVAAVDLEQYH